MDNSYILQFEGFKIGELLVPSEPFARRLKFPPGCSDRLLYSVFYWASLGQFKRRAMSLFLDYVPFCNTIVHGQVSVRLLRFPKLMKRSSLQQAGTRGMHETPTKGHLCLPSMVACN